MSLRGPDLKTIVTVAEVKELLGKGQTYSEIAELLDIKEKSLSAYMVRNGVRVKNPNAHGKDTNQLRRLREASGLSINEVADRMNITQQAVSAHELNKRQPSERNALKYAVLYDVPSIYEESEGNE